MAEPQTLTEKCIEACDNCSMQCNGSAFQAEMMGGMEAASRLGRICADACASHAIRLKEGDESEADACIAACTKFIPEAETVYRHLASFQESAFAAQSVIESIGLVSSEKAVAK